MATKKNASKKNEKKVIRWSDVSGEMKVFGNKVEYKKNGKKKSFLKYATSVSVKDEDGDYSNFYFNVGFKKDEAPDIEGMFTINIKKGFISFETYEDKHGKDIKIPKVVILEYECDESSDGDEEESDDDDDDDDDGDRCTEIESLDPGEDDLPF